METIAYRILYAERDNSERPLQSSPAWISLNQAYIANNVFLFHTNNYESVC